MPSAESLLVFKMSQPVHLQTLTQSPSLEAARIWVLTSEAEDAADQQIQVLIDALGVNVRKFVLKYESWQPALSLIGAVGRIGLHLDVRYDLAPPWPDLVFCASAEAEPIARWIRRRAKMMYQRTQLVRIGRPWVHPSHFDLIITTPQYPVPPAPNVLVNRLPLHGLSQATLARAYKAHLPAFRQLPKPHYVLLVTGGQSVLGLHAYQRRFLIQHANRMARTAAGTLCINAGANLSDFVRRLIDEEATVRRPVYDWPSDRTDAQQDGYIAHGDAFIVAGNNASLLAQALYTGRPVYIYHPQYCHAGQRVAQTQTGIARQVLHRLGALFGWRKRYASLDEIQTRLVAEGRAVWLGETFTPHTHPPIDDLSQTLAAVRKLFD